MSRRRQSSDDQKDHRARTARRSRVAEIQAAADTVAAHLAIASWIRALTAAADGGCPVLWSRLEACISWALVGERVN